MLKYLSLLVLAVAGLIGGLILSGAITSRREPEKTHRHRFPLTAFDVKETAEAPELAVDVGGRVFLVWPSKIAESDKTLSLAMSDDGGVTFTEPRVVARSGIFKATSTMRGKTITREVRMAPHVAVSDGAVHLAWTETLPDMKGVRLVAATSMNRGETLGAPVAVHHGDGARATYTSLSARPDGSLLCGWLDNRHGSQQTFAAIRPAGSVGFEAEQVVHPGAPGKGVCPCCPTASLLAPDGTAYVAFRNVDGEYRDIVVGRKLPGDTGYDLFPVVPPTWKFSGCPHDGPSMVILGDVLHIVWMDAHTGAPRCYHATANVGDMKFTAASLHDIPAGSQGNAKLVRDSGGVVHAVWEESLAGDSAPTDDSREVGQEPKHEHGAAGGSGRAIMTASLPAGAKSFGHVRPVAPKPGVFQTRPSVALAGDSLIVAWNELDTTGKAVVVSTCPIVTTGAQ